MVKTSTHQGGMRRRGDCDEKPSHHGWTRRTAFSRDEIMGERASVRPHQIFEAGAGYVAPSLSKPGMSDPGQMHLDTKKARRREERMGYCLERVYLVQCK